MEIKKARLGISDLLILISAVCIYFVVGEHYEAGRYKLGIILRTQFAILSGLAFGGMGVCLNHWIKTKRRLDYPGHRLWFCLGLQSLIWLLVTVSGLPTGFSRGSTESNPVEFVTIYVVAFIGSVVLLLFGCKNERWWWRTTFLPIAVLWLQTATGMICALFDVDFPNYLLIPTYPLIVAPILVIISVVCDNRAGLKKDWIHFAGIAIFLLTYLGSRLFMMIVTRFYSMRELMVEM